MVNVSCSIGMDRNNCRTSLKLVQIIRPLLHHRATLFQKFRPVVRSAQGIWNAMSQLMLNNCRIKVQLFVKNCPSHRTEAVAGYLRIGVVTHAPKSGIHRSFTYGLLRIAFWNA